MVEQSASNALKILQVFKLTNARAGHALLEGVFWGHSERIALPQSAIGQALKDALSMNWIERGDNNHFVLTEVGFKELRGL